MFWICMNFRCRNASIRYKKCKIHNAIRYEKCETYHIIRYEKCCGVFEDYGTIRTEQWRMYVS